MITYQGTEQVDEDEEAHRETAETAELIEEDKFAQVVHGRVDPTTTLGEQNPPVIGGYSERVSVADELSLEIREVFEQQCRKVTIFTKVEEVLHVQRVDSVFRVILD